MPPRHSRALALAALVLGAPSLSAQTVPDTTPPAGPPPPVVTRSWLLPGPAALDGPAEERARLRQVLGQESPAGWLLRTPSSRVPAPAGGIRISVLAPEAAVVWNSAIPYSLNDGATWAGRGRTTTLSAGVQVEAGRVRLVLAPQVFHAENRDFQVFPGRDTLRSRFSSPWYTGGRSADLPLRFGTQPLTVLDPGQSSLSVYAGPLVFGAATENQWWGPGIRNAIVLSNHAAGFPHAFLRTVRPLRTGLGEVEASWIVGGLTQSVYFDTIPRGGTRSLSGFAATFTPRGETGLSLGVARTVYDLSSASGVVGHALDVFTRAGARTPAGDTIPSSGPEQVTSLFVRWVLPGDGAEVYAEWARATLPGSLSDLLEAPNHSQGYTLGMQWAHPLNPATAFRLQSELTYLEQSPTARYRRVPTYYTSASVPQGYTNRGQVLGAAIGPGSSSQWLAGDLVSAGWRAGVFAGRIRWEDDAHRFSTPMLAGQTKRSSLSHDVSLLGGARGGVLFRDWEVGAELTIQRRLNYLFQNPDAGYGVTPPPGTQVDLWNTTLRFTVSPGR
jgi:hypothetical protein